MRGKRGYHAPMATRDASFRDAPRAPNATLRRRDLLLAGAGSLALPACAGRGPVGEPRRARPPGKTPAWGVQSGDVTSSSGVVWCRADAPGLMAVEWSTSPRFERAVRVPPFLVGPGTDLVGKAPLVGLPSGQAIHYRVSVDGSPWQRGSFATPSEDGRDVVLAWSGDTNGQGWGIDPARGGMPAYASLLARAPDLFVHCGDAIYADDPIFPTIELPDGSRWNNVVDPGKTHVAETLEDFRAAHRYPRRSSEVRAFSAAVPVFSIWDDHEVHNNWFPGQVLDDARYTERRIDTLALEARRAMLEYAPTLASASGPLYRKVAWGPLLDLFLLDGRTFRSPNEPAPPEGALLGAAQAAWLLDELARSRAAWKVVACGMPIALVVSEPGKTVPRANDGWGNDDGAPREREVELARLLSGLKARRVTNVVWITADVHYAAAHRMDPARAAFKDFDPFWELVAGPMHATAFPRKPLDDTFGPEVAWASADWDTLGSPASGAQHFGLLRVDGRTRDLVVTFVDARGRDLHRLTLTPS